METLKMVSEMSTEERANAYTKLRMDQYAQTELDDAAKVKASSETIEAQKHHDEVLAEIRRFIK